MQKERQLAMEVLKILSARGLTINTLHTSIIDTCPVKSWVVTIPNAIAIRARGAEHTSNS